MITKKYLEKEKEGKQQCQNCLEFGHWTYECTRPQTYVYRPSRTKLFKQNNFNLFNIKDQKREESPKKDEKDKDKETKRNKSESYSSSYSSSSSRSKNSKKRNRSSSSGSSPGSIISSNSSYSSSSFSRSESENSKNQDEIIQNKKRKKLNEMLDNIAKNDKEKEKEKNKIKNKNRDRSYSRSKSRSRSRHHHHKKEYHKRRRSRSRSRSRSDSRRKFRKNEEILKNNNRNTFYGEYKLKKGERWKKIAEIEEEEKSDSPGNRGKNGAFRKRPYE